MTNEILNAIRNSPHEAKTLAMAMNHVGVFIGAHKMPEVQYAVIADIERNYGGCTKSYLDTARRDPNTALYSFGRKEVGLI